MSIRFSSGKPKMLKRAEEMKRFYCKLDGQFRYMSRFLQHINGCASCRDFYVSANHFLLEI